MATSAATAPEQPLDGWLRLLEQTLVRNDVIIGRHRLRLGIPLRSIRTDAASLTWKAVLLCVCLSAGHN